MRYQAAGVGDQAIKVGDVEDGRNVIREEVGYTGRSLKIDVQVQSEPSAPALGDQLILLRDLSVQSLLLIGHFLNDQYS